MPEYRQLLPQGFSFFPVSHRHGACEVPHFALGTWLFLGQHMPPDASCSAEVLTLASIADLGAHVRPGDQIYLDIDETLVSPENDAGEPWAVGFKEALCEGGASAAAAWPAAVELWQALQGTCVVVAPEGDETCRQLLAFKAAGFPLVGLTARGPEVAAETLGQLSRCGLGGLLDERCSLGELPPADGAPADGTPLAHANGIIFCSGSRKPAGLLAFEEAARCLERRAEQPPRSAEHLPSGSRVLLVDDRLAHCEAVGCAMAFH